MEIIWSLNNSVIRAFLIHSLRQFELNVKFQIFLISCKTIQIVCTSKTYVDKILCSVWYWNTRFQDAERSHNLSTLFIMRNLKKITIWSSKKCDITKLQKLEQNSLKLLTFSKPVRSAHKRPIFCTSDGSH